MKRKNGAKLDKGVRTSGLFSFSHVLSYVNTNTSCIHLQNFDLETGVSWMKLLLCFNLNDKCWIHKFSWWSLWVFDIFEVSKQLFQLMPGNNHPEKDQEIGNRHAFNFCPLFSLLIFSFWSLMYVVINYQFCKFISFCLFSPLEDWPWYRSSPNFKFLAARL